MSTTTTLTRSQFDWSKYDLATSSYSRSSTPRPINHPSTPRLQSTTLSRSSSTSSTSTIRPTSSHKRTSSKDSSGWYNAEENMTLEDFADRLQSWEKRLEKWTSTCATNIVMALLRPTPIALFVLHPVCLFFLAIAALCMWALR